MGGDLFPYYDKGKKLYLIGRIGAEEIQLSLGFKELAGNQVNVPVSMWQSETGSSGNWIKTAGNQAYIRYQSMADSTESQKAWLKEFIDFGKTAQGMDSIVLDVRGNGGGSDGYHLMFYLALTGQPGSLKSQGDGSDIATTKMIFSPIVLQAMNSKLGINEAALMTIKHELGLNGLKRLEELKSDLASNPRRLFWTFDTPEIEAQYSEIKPGNFKGRLIIITDKQAASSGELLPFFFSWLPNTIVIGENTAGHLNNKMPMNYFLPHSRLVVWVPMMKCRMSKLDPNYINAGSGISPDYWIGTDSQLIETLGSLGVNSIFLNSQ